MRTESTVRAWVALVAVVPWLNACDNVGPVDYGPDAGSDADTDSDGDGDTDSDSDTDTGGVTLPEGFEDALAPYGCGDVYVYGCSGDETADQICLFLSIEEELALQACEVGETTTVLFEVDGFEGELYAQRGTYLDMYWCNDAIWEEPVVWRTFTAVSGSALLTLVPDAADSACEPYDLSVDATLELTDVVLEAEDDPDVTATIETLTWEGVSVGWLAG
jgi:hypothetical protein